MCEKDLFDRHNKNDVGYMFYSLAQSIADISYNFDERFYKNVRSPITVKSLCDIMLNESLGDPVSLYEHIYEYDLGCN